MIVRYRCQDNILGKSNLCSSAGFIPTYRLKKLSYYRPFSGTYNFLLKYALTIFLLQEPKGWICVKWEANQKMNEFCNRASLERKKTCSGRLKKRNERKGKNSGRLKQRRKKLGRSHKRQDIPDSTNFVQPCPDGSKICASKI